MGKRGTVNHLYSGQRFLLIATTHAHEGLVPCLVDVRGFEIVQQVDKEVTAGTLTILRRMARTSVWVNFNRMFPEETLFA